MHGMTCHICICAPSPPPELILDFVACMRVGGCAVEVPVEGRRGCQISWSWNNRRLRATQQLSSTTKLILKITNIWKKPMTEVKNWKLLSQVYMWRAEHTQEKPQSTSAEGREYVLTQKRAWLSWPQACLCASNFSQILGPRPPSEVISLNVLYFYYYACILTPVLCSETLRHKNLDISAVPSRLLAMPIPKMVSEAICFYTLRRRI